MEIAVSKKSLVTCLDKVGLKYGFRSGLEIKVADQLAQVGGIKVQYEEVKLSYTQPESEHKYTPDFVLTGTKGKSIIIETKGRFLQADRKKHDLIRKQYPELDLRFVFTNPNAKISKVSKTTYASWCLARGYMYAKGAVPKEWLDELK